MKILFILLTSFTSFTTPDAAIFSLCHVEVNSVNVSGTVGFSDGEIDLSDACVTFTGTVSVCDGSGNELGSLSFTAQSSGCDEDPLIEPNDPTHTLQTIEEIYDLSALNEGEDIEMSLPLAYPNPTNDRFTLTNLAAGYEISLISSKTGGLVQSFKTNSQGEDITIDTSQLEPGTYYLNTINKDLKTNITQTIVVK